VLLSSSNEAVLAAAESLGESLRAAKSESTQDTFESLLDHCNEEINDETGLEYGDLCDTDSGCC